MILDIMMEDKARLYFMAMTMLQLTTCTIHLVQALKQPVHLSYHHMVPAIIFHTCL
ncbi:MAG: hypothetical protein RXR17_06950 [Sulfolobaceae archaeon]